MLWVSDVTRPATSAADPEYAARLPAGVPRVHVLNKIDIPATRPYQRVSGAMAEVGLSAKSGAGLDLLKSAILSAVGWGGAGEGIYMARERHLEALHLAATHIAQSVAQITQIELLAEELKLAQQALSSITGEVTADDLLGRIFSSFCIGK